VEIAVRDNGPGIPESARARIFEPFFTTKPVGKGTGQGLAMSRNVIVKRHGGTLTFKTGTGEGTTFLIRLPLETAATTHVEAA
jgi:signal transduction histidine kinase